MTQDPAARNESESQAPAARNQSESHAPAPTGEPQSQPQPQPQSQPEPQPETQPQSQPQPQPRPQSQPEPQPHSLPEDPLELLLALQDLDTVISQLQHRRATLPERAQLAEIDARLAALARAESGAGAARDELAARQSALEHQIAAASDRRRTIEQRLYAARGTPSRDLQAMDEEIRHLDRRQSQLEDAELEIMVEREPFDAALGAIEEERAGLTGGAAGLREAIAAAEAVIAAELSERESSRADAARRLPIELADRYERLRARLGGTGAARLVGNRCTGCHLELPSMEVDRIRHLPPGTIVTCDQCGRILVPAPPD